MVDYEVGYGKPPKSSQFKKGQSGNPRGRKRGSKNFATKAKEALKAKVPLNKNGEQVEVTVEEALLKVLTHSGLKGNMRAIEKLLDFAREFDAEELAAGAEKEVTRQESEVLERFTQRTMAAASLADRLETFEEGAGI